VFPKLPLANRTSASNSTGVLIPTEAAPQIGEM
jgi:hypothetical protein